MGRETRFAAAPDREKRGACRAQNLLARLVFDCSRITHLIIWARNTRRRQYSQDKHPFQRKQQTTKLATTQLFPHFWVTKALPPLARPSRLPLPLPLPPPPHRLPLAALISDRSVRSAAAWPLAASVFPSLLLLTRELAGPNGAGFGDSGNGSRKAGRLVETSSTATGPRPLIRGIFC